MDEWRSGELSAGELEWRLPVRNGGTSSFFYIVSILAYMPYAYTLNLGVEKLMENIG